MRRAKNLQETDVERIVDILDGWTGRLTWGGFIEAIEKRLFTTYTRQALHKHPSIQRAFSQRKKTLTGIDGKPRKVVSAPELQAALDRIARLVAKNERLEAERTQLLEQFARWVYNASGEGLNEEFLNQPLPDVGRQATKSRAERAVTLLGRKS